MPESMELGGIRWKKMEAGKGVPRMKNRESTCVFFFGFSVFEIGRAHV